MEENKKLAGQIVLEHDLERLELEDDIIEYRKRMEPSVMKDVQDCALKAKDHIGYINKDFYVVLIITTDRILRQPKFMKIARKSCPTPVYKQSVWKYRHLVNDLEFLWSIPSKELYYHILRNKYQFLNDRETQKLAQFVILMETGDLLKWVKKENGNKIDAVIKIKKQEELCLMI